MPYPWNSWRENARRVSAQWASAGAAVAVEMGIGGWGKSGWKKSVAGGWVGSAAGAAVGSAAAAAEESSVGSCPRENSELLLQKREKEDKRRRRQGQFITSGPGIGRRGCAPLAVAPC